MASSTLAVPASALSHRHHRGRLIGDPIKSSDESADHPGFNPGRSPTDPVRKERSCFACFAPEYKSNELRTRELAQLARSKEGSSRGTDRFEDGIVVSGVPLEAWRSPKGAGRGARSNAGTVVPCGVKRTARQCRRAVADVSWQTRGP
eukprot:scaffold938_cov334-Pavlova_lutheri.AAC.31